MSIVLPSATVDVTVGIDISKHHLDVHVHPEGCIQQFDNNRAGHARLIAWISPRKPTRIIFEATGAYHRGLHNALAKAGLPGVRVNPWQARRFAEATGKRAKTDAVDAAILARFGATLQPDPTPAREPAVDSLAELLAARRALVKDRTAALNRGKNLTLPLLKRQNQQHLKQIAAQINDIDREQAALVELGSLEARQVASLGGLAPITRQSGNWQGKSRIQGGRAPLRQALYMPALVAIRFNPPLKAKYLALRAAGKPAKVAIVAIMRKLLIIANALLRDQRRWTPELASA